MVAANTHVLIKAFMIPEGHGAVYTMQNVCKYLHHAWTTEDTSLDDGYC